MDTLGQDLRFGLRLLGRSRGSSVVALLTLAAGIGASTATFSVFSAVRLQALPYPDADRLVGLLGRMEASGLGDMRVSYPNYESWREALRGAATLAAYEDNYTVTATSRPDPLRLRANFVTAGYLELLGALPALGRTLLPGESRPPHGGRAVVISHALWGTLFGERPDVLGRSLELDGESYEVVGVLRAGFADLSSARHPTDVWLPFPHVTRVSYPEVLQDRGAHWFSVLARLGDATSRDRVDAALATVMGRLTAEHADTHGYTARAVPLREILVGDLEPLLGSLLAGALLVALIGASNVANLLLSRASARQLEIAVRSAMGASHRRLARQLLTEGLLLAALAGSLGVLLAAWATPLVLGASPIALPSFVAVGPDPAVLGFSVALAGLLGVILALGPVWHARAARLGAGLRRATRDVARGGARLRSVLVISQMAIAVVCLVGAALLLESFARLRTTGLGFRTEDVLALRVDLPASRYPDGAGLRALGRRLREELGAAPGVRSADFWGPGMPGEANWFTGTMTEGDPVDRYGDAIPTRNHHVTPGALTQMGFELTRGRDIEEHDRERSDAVAVVSRSLAERMWPGEDPLGRRFTRFLDQSVWYRVVGVAADVSHGGRVGDGADNRYDMYVAWFQVPRRELVLMVDGVSAEAAALAVRGALRSADPDLPPYEMRTLEERLRREERGARFAALVAGPFALLALCLAVLGLFASSSQLTAARSREMGLRVALGARPRQVFGLVAAEGVRLAVAGVAAGLLLAGAGSRLLESQLFGVRPLEPWTYAGVSLLLGVASVAACLVPARRATRVDPLAALRAD